MLHRIKIQTAILIALVFMFRLFYANVCITAAQQNSKTCKFVSSHFKTVLKKRRKDLETVVKNKVETSSSQEVFEEARDTEEEPIKGDAPVVLSYLYSPLVDHASIFNPDNFPVHLNCGLLSKKYLAFSILRI